MATLLEGIVSWAVNVASVAFIVGINKRLIEKRVDRLLDWIEDKIKRIVKMVLKR